MTTKYDRDATYAYLAERMTDEALAARLRDMAELGVSRASYRVARNAYLREAARRLEEKR